MNDKNITLLFKSVVYENNIINNRLDCTHRHKFNLSCGTTQIITINANMNSPTMTSTMIKIMSFGSEMNEQENILRSLITLMYHNQSIKY